MRCHHGVIFVHSAPSQGTTFRILLPAANRDAGMVGRAPAANTDSIPDGSVVLVIDDERTVLNVAEGALSRRGARVLTAEDGRRGVEIFREHRDVISVVILDLQMPVMGGEQALPLLHEANPDIPVILSSGFDEKEVTRRFSRLKPTSFLQKPFTAQRLIEAVAAVLQER